MTLPRPWGAFLRIGTPAVFNRFDNVVSMIPRSKAIPATVAVGVDRYSSAASRRNPSEYVFLAMIRSSRFLQVEPGISVSTIRGQGPDSYLVRERPPKGTVITDHQPYRDAIAEVFNEKLRAALGFYTPREIVEDLIKASIASTSRHQAAAPSTQHKASPRRHLTPATAPPSLADHLATCQ
ncbi:hypothetical protein [Sanguibacter antarcticus]|uniref:hypothetical protein n=1 Tax=Sanguibacter antarcticus TaxID=372484 RepID=UPI003CCB8759